MKRRVAILISGRGSNMVALIEAARPADFPAEIVLVISNRADAPGLEKAKASGIPTVVIESNSFGKDRAGFEAVLQSTLEQHSIELICLGGFMRLFTAEFAKRWYGRMLNIHPSLLPSFPGLDPHGQALRAGVKISGATVHFVIPETDDAMRSAQRKTERILEVEHRIYPDALRLLASGKIRLEGEICKIEETAGSGNFLISPAAT